MEQTRYCQSDRHNISQISFEAKLQTNEYLKIEKEIFIDHKKSLPFV
jgi:hypothetical protein